MMNQEDSMTRFHFYPDKWDNKSKECRNGLIQNRNGMEPSSCEEIQITGGHLDHTKVKLIV